MREILIAILGVLISVLVGVLYYGVRMTCVMRKENNRLADRVTELEQVERDAEKLCFIYEDFLVENWNKMQKAIFMIEHCKPECDEQIFPYADWLAELKQNHQYNLDLLLGIGFKLDKYESDNAIVINDVSDVSDVVVQCL